MMILGLVIGLVSAISLLFTKSPSPLLPISALGCLIGLALIVLGSSWQ